MNNTNVNHEEQETTKTTPVFPELTNIFHGFKAGELVVIMAKTNVGKSRINLDNNQ